MKRAYPDPMGRKDHWIVDDMVVAGAKTAEEAISLLEAAQNHGAEDVPLTPDDVRAEAARRMRVLVGARDDRHLNIIISNGQREAARLLRKQVAGQTLTPEEEVRARELEQVDAALEAIRAASNALEAMRSIPEDFADDRWWP